MKTDLSLPKVQKTLGVLIGLLSLSQVNGFNLPSLPELSESRIANIDQIVHFDRPHDSFHSLSRYELIALHQQLIKNVTQFQQFESKPRLKEAEEEEELLTPGTGQWWLELFIVIFCMLFAGLMSGLTVGLASVDRLSLEIQARSNEEVKRQCDRIFPVIDKHHWMLVTLLLMNASAGEYMPLALSKMVKEYLAIIISMTGVLIFGEIVPQALCTGPSQTKIAYYMCPVVQVFMWITAPITWPIAWLLDKMMGEHEIARFSNDQLKNLILLHAKVTLEGMEHVEDVEGLDGAQERIIVGALQMNETKVVDISTMYEHVEPVYLDTELNEDNLKWIRCLGFSRIPVVYSRQHPESVLGLLMAKSLIGVQPMKSPLDESRCLNVQELYCMKKIQIKQPLYVMKDSEITKLMKQFRAGHSHMAIVCANEKTHKNLGNLSDLFFDESKQVRDGYESFQELGALVLPENELPDFQDTELIGVLTLENVLERILQVDILDERDRVNLEAQRAQGVVKSASSNVLTISPYTSTAGGMRKRQPTVKYQYRQAEQNEFQSVNNLNMLTKEAQEEKTQIYQNDFISNFAANFEQIASKQVVPLDGRNKSVNLASVSGTSLYVKRNTIIQSTDQERFTEVKLLKSTKDDIIREEDEDEGTSQII